MAGTSIEKNLILKQLEIIHRRIEAACHRGGRDPIERAFNRDFERATVRKKSKRHWQAGQKLFGENYVQEALPKKERLPQAEWHFIGALQTNKVKLVAGNFALIHSVDREKLLAAISEAAKFRNAIQDILFEINIAGESTKSGMEMRELERLLPRLREWTGVRARGLMCMPPSGDAESSRAYFRRAKAILEKWRTNDFKELSMGTSQDFEAAIEEGATMIRIGTGVFGERSRK